MQSLASHQQGGSVISSVDGLAKTKKKKLSGAERRKKVSW
jgi:hypothetical protein